MYCLYPPSLSSLIYHQLPLYLNKSREKLDKDKSLIGFVGAPWTLLIYMLDLKLNKNGINYAKIGLKKNEVNISLYLKNISP